MKHIFTTGLVAIALLGLNAFAQGDWYHDRDERFRGEQWRAHLFEHVRVDLDHVGSAIFAAPRERRRLDTTKRELADLQNQMMQTGGHYNERELNDVIDSMVKSANDQRLAPRDREMLNDDLNRLRDYRANHDHWMR